MAQGHRAFSEVLDVILAAGILVVLGLAVDIGGVIGVVLFVGYMVAIIYREFHKEDPDIESGGNIHQFFSQETHDLWNSKDMRGKVLFVLGRILLIIVGLYLGFYIFMMVVAWFYSQLII